VKSLFQLVKSLDKSEKRYFKLFCQKHVINGSNNDAELFDAIVSLKEFTEESLRAALKNDKIISNLSVYKHILHRNILKSLNAYHSSRTIEDEILDLYKSSKVLYEKCLYQDSKRLIERAKKLAYDNECFTLYLLLAEAENGLHNRHFDVDDYKAVVIDGMEQDKKVVEQVKNFLAMRKIHSELFYNIRMWGVRDPEFNKQKFSADLIEQFNAIKDKMKFDKAKQFAWHFQSLDAYRKGENKLSADFELKIIKMLESKPENYPSKNEDLLMAYNGLVWNYFFCGEHKKVREVLVKVNKIPDTTGNIRLIKFQLFINYEMLEKTNFNNSTQTSEQIEQRIVSTVEEYKDAMSLQMLLTIQFNLAILFFVEGKYEKARHWIEIVLESQKMKVKTDLIIAARLMQLVLQYELSLHTLIKYSILSTRRFIKKHRVVSKFEMEMFSFLTKLSETKERVKKQEIYRTFIQKIETLLAQGKALDMSFSYHIWAKAKLENKPFRKVFEEERAKESKALKSH